MGWNIARYTGKVEIKEGGMGCMHGIIERIWHQLVSKSQEKVSS